MAGHNIELKQHAEWNMARIGLIPAQSKIPAQFLMGWEEIKEDESIRSLVRASTGEPCGIPYGLANDVLSALMTLAVTTANENMDGKIKVTFEELSKLMFLNRNNGKAYKDIANALDSLSATTFTVENRWRTPLYKKRSFERFSLINKFGLYETVMLGGSVEKHIYAVELNELLWQSAKGGLTLALSPTLLQSLNSPSSRAIYRMLESYRRSEDDLQDIFSDISLRAVDFANAARLLSTGIAISDRLTTMTRKNGIFEQLYREDYLKSIDITGRGDATILHFRFSDSETRNIIDSRAEKLLIEAGVYPSHALKLAGQHTAEAVECAIWFTEQAIKKQQGTLREIKNPQGFIIELLASGDALNKLNEYTQLKKKVVQVKKRVNAEGELPSLPELTIYEQLNNILKIKKIKTELSNKLKVFASTEELKKEHIVLLLHSLAPDEDAQQIISQLTK